MQGPLEQQGSQVQLDQQVPPDQLGQQVLSVLRALREVQDHEEPQVGLVFLVTRVNRVLRDRKEELVYQDQLETEETLVLEDL